MDACSAARKLAAALSDIIVDAEASVVDDIVEVLRYLKRECDRERNAIANLQAFLAETEAR